MPTASELGRGAFFAVPDVIGRGFLDEFMIKNGGEYPCHSMDQGLSAGPKLFRQWA